MVRRRLLPVERRCELTSGIGSEQEPVAHPCHLSPWDTAVTNGSLSRPFARG